MVAFFFGAAAFFFGAALAAVFLTLTTLKESPVWVSLPAATAWKNERKERERKIA